MGTYTYFDSQTIDVIDPFRLGRLKERLKKAKIPEHQAINEDGTVDFNLIGDWKLHHYYYPSTREFLLGLAECITGTVQFHTDGDEPYARWLFSGGEVKVLYEPPVTIDWTKAKTESITMKGDKK